MKAPGSSTSVSNAPSPTRQKLRQCCGPRAGRAAGGGGGHPRDRKGGTMTRHVRVPAGVFERNTRTRSGCPTATRAQSRESLLLAERVTSNPRGLRETRSQTEAHLGGDDSVVGVSLRDVGLSTWGGLPVPHVDGPAVHPVLFSGTLLGTEWREQGDRSSRSAVWDARLTRTGCPGHGRPDPTQPPWSTFPKDWAEWAVCSPRKAGGKPLQAGCQGKGHGGAPRRRRGTIPGSQHRRAAVRPPGAGEDRRAGRHRGRSRSPLEASPSERGGCRLARIRIIQGSCP